MNGNLFEEPAPSGGGWLIAHCDGGSRGNPGPAGYGAVIEDDRGQVVARLSEFLGIQTNNFAEYSGLLAVLKWANENGAKQLRVVSDSELMVKQMQGKYAVKSPVLRPLYEEARKMARRLESFEMRHTLRGGNKDADALANEAMDRGMGKGREQGTATPASNYRSPGPPAGIRDQARPYGKLETTPVSRPVAAPAPKPERQVLEGYVKDGVVHLLGGELPDGIFVKVVRE
jgi:probable phosphoglycerate mutase